LFDKFRYQFAELFLADVMFNWSDHSCGDDEEVNDYNDYGQQFEGLTKFVVDQWLSVELDHVCEAHQVEAQDLERPLVKEFKSEIPNSSVRMASGEVYRVEDVHKRKQLHLKV